MKFLGIDVGTGGTRAVLIDSQGEVIAAETAEHAPFASPEIGWARRASATKLSKILKTLAAKTASPSRWQR